MDDLDLSAFDNIISQRGFSVKPEYWGEHARLTFIADSWPEDEQETIYGYMRDAWPTPPAGWSPIGDAVSPCDEGLFVDYARRT